MSSWVTVTNALLKSPNPSTLNSDFVFEVSFQCLEDLTLPLHWRLVYVGSAENKSKDQEIEAIELGPVKRGSLKFSFEADAPDFSQLESDEIWGTTVLLLEGSYRMQCFVRVGWYVHNYYVDPILQDDPPDIPQLDKMARWVNTNEPRVTRFAINWTRDSELPPMPEADAAKAVAQSMDNSSSPDRSDGEHTSMCESAPLLFSNGMNNGVPFQSSNGSQQMFMSQPRDGFPSQPDTNSHVQSHEVGFGMAMNSQQRFVGTSFSGAPFVGASEIQQHSTMLGTSVWGNGGVAMATFDEHHRRF